MSGKSAKKFRKVAQASFGELLKNICEEKFHVRLRLAWSILTKRDHLFGTKQKAR
jgi:hypothetical protein